MSSIPDEAEITVTGLKKSFRNLVAVDNISFEVNRGEIFGLLGPNGAGKTTTINMICGLLPATGGTIEFHSHKIKKIRSVIGYCPQENICFPKLTCLEQLVFMGNLYGMPPKQCRSIGLGLLEMLGLIDKSKVYARNLSGGMKRRLNIALALIHNPRILILDEPEAGLDPQSRVMVRNFIKSLSKEKTIILTSHNMDEVDRLADRVAIMDYGKIILTDTPYNLKNSIGEGDVLEIEFIENPVGKTDKLISDLRHEYKVIQSGNSLIIIAVHLIDKIHDITSSIKDEGLNIKEIKLRENTLEDVFIHLTGRMLRQ
ncbi:MAG: ABC transporter ATP-binding protein [Bacteroidales bacterium]|nr:ABC transporter ATP-binding protein [Bacteroidales bacterium]